MDVEQWYKRAFVITQGHPLYKDFVHDVYIKVQRKAEPYNDSYILRAIINRWVDENRKKREETLKDYDNIGQTQHYPIEYEDYDLDPFELEVLESLNEGYRLKEIAEICEVGNQFVYSVFRSIKNKVRDSK